MTIGVFILSLMTTACSPESFKPKPTGMVNDTLHPCPSAPKCVSSLEPGSRHYVKPLRYSSDMSTARTRLIEIINSIDGSKIVSQQPGYIHAQFTVTPLKWIDDTEFLFSEENKIIHLSSSASAKFGYWDWGENRRRAEMLRQEFEEN